MKKIDFKFKIKNFSLRDTLYCGQCFRFREIDKNIFLVFFNSYSSYVEQKQDWLLFYSSSCDVSFWRKYFNFEVDYSVLLKGFKGDLVLEKLIRCCSGIRILKQDPFETLICFILSINNNILRIQKIIEVLCKNFGEKIKNGYSFPKLDVLSNCSEKDFKILKAGFRTKFLLDAIYKVSSGFLDLKKLYFLSFEEAKKELMKVYGVGNKVSDCVLLFAYNKMQSFPVDVWIKKVLNEYYKDGVSKQILSCPGLAQQLLFFGKRSGYI